MLSQKKTHETDAGKIKQLREKLSLSQQALAERGGVTLRNLQRAEKLGERVGMSTLTGIARSLGVDVAAIVKSEERQLTDWEKSIGIEVLRLKKLLKTSEIASRLRPWPRRKTLDFAFEIDPSEELGNLIAAVVTLLGALRDNLTTNMGDDDAARAAEQVRTVGQINQRLEKLAALGVYLYYGSYIFRSVEWEAEQGFYTVKSESRVKVIVATIDKTQITREIEAGTTIGKAIEELKDLKNQNYLIDEEWLQGETIPF